MCNGCKHLRREALAVLSAARSALAELAGGDATGCRAEASDLAQAKLRFVVARLEPLTESQRGRAKRLREEAHAALAAANDDTADTQRKLAV